MSNELVHNSPNRHAATTGEDTPARRNRRGVFAVSDAGYAGSKSGRPINQPIVGIAPASRD